MSSVSVNQDADVVGKAFQTLPPSASILENFATVIMSDFDSLQMEEQKAILTFFKTLSGEENEDIIRGDSELSFSLKKNGVLSIEDALENNRDSLSYLLLPLGGEKITSDSMRVSRSKAGNGIDMTDEEKNIVNLLEQQSKTVNTENVSENSATNQELNKLPDDHCDKVDGCSNEGCHMSLGDCALKDCLQAKCQHILTDCANTDYVCVGPIQQDDTKEANRKEYGNVSCQVDLLTSAPGSDIGFDPEESARHRPSKAKYVAITMAQTGPEAEEQVLPILKTTLEQTEGPSCFKSAGEEERTGAKEDSKKEKTDAFPYSSTQPHYPFSPKNTSPNIIIKPADVDNNPPPGSTFSRATFSPGSPSEKQIQLPTLFSGLRVLRKGVVGPEYDTVAQIRHSSQRPKGDIFPEKQGDAKVHGGFLEQISHFLSQEKRADEKEEKKVMEAEGDNSRENNEREENEDGERKEVETEEDVELFFQPAKPVSSAEAAFDAFKAFFTPKPLKKDPAEKVDLEAVMKKIRADKDALRALFESTSIKTPEKKDPPDCQVGIMYESAMSINRIFVICYFRKNYLYQSHDFIL